MAINTIFEGEYGERGAIDQEYTVRIGSISGTVGTIAAEHKRFEMYEPGFSVKWPGSDMIRRGVMGSSLSFTAALNETQLSKWNQMLDADEGDIYIFVYKGPPTSSAALWWFGHLLIEQTSIQIEQDRSHISCTFTDGLGQLSGAPFVDDNGDDYVGLKKCSFWIKEILMKLPGVKALKETYPILPLFNEAGLPFYEAKHTDGNFYKFPETDPVLDRTRIYARTFQKPKTEVNRIRELEALPEFFSCREVLDDLCQSFGACICLQGGRFHFVSNTSLALFQGSSSMKANQYIVTFATGNLTPVTDTNTSYNIGSISSNRYYLEGATKNRTMPVKQANLVHQDGGSDIIYQDGFFLNRRYDDDIFGTGRMPILNEIRRDLNYEYQQTAVTGPAVSTSWRIYPHVATDYTGFPAKTIEDLEIASGQDMRINFGGHIGFSRDGTISGSPFPRAHVGCTVILRMRLQITDVNGENYRLSRTVFTHKQTAGVDDYITINNVSVAYDVLSGSFTYVDRNYFRKLYNNLDWVHEDEVGYADAWFELIIPHHETLNTGDTWSSTVYPLTEQYGAQEGCAPIGTEPEDTAVTGAGVVLKNSDDDGTFSHYFREDIRLFLPQDLNGDDVSFETFYVEWGLEEWLWNEGPRCNDGTAFTPLWRSSTAGNTDGTEKYSGAGNWRNYPEFVHFWGARIFAGDGSETADITTKVRGGDGYEVMSLGSSRVGSRLTYQGIHALGTIWGDVRTSATTWGTYQLDKLRWRPHNPEDVTYGAGASIVYDSLHAVACTEFLEVLGKSRSRIDGSIIARNNNGTAFIGPLQCFSTSQLDGTFSYNLMPMNMEWSLYGGSRFTALAVGFDRYDEITAYEEDYVSTRGGGRVYTKPGFGSVSVAFEGAGVQDDIDGIIDDVNGLTTTVNTKSDELELFAIFIEK